LSTKQQVEAAAEAAGVFAKLQSKTPEETGAAIAKASSDIAKQAGLTAEDADQAAVEVATAQGLPPVAVHLGNKSAVIGAETDSGKADVSNATAAAAGAAIGAAGKGGEDDIDFKESGDDNADANAEAKEGGDENGDANAEAGEGGDDDSKKSDDTTGSTDSDRGFGAGQYVAASAAAVALCCAGAAGYYLSGQAAKAGAAKADQNTRSAPVEGLAAAGDSAGDLELQNPLLRGNIQGPVLQGAPGFPVLTVPTTSIPIPQYSLQAPVTYTPVPQAGFSSMQRNAPGMSVGMAAPGMSVGMAAPGMSVGMAVPPGVQGQMTSDMMRRFGVIDTNHDGQISRQEWANASAFEAIDTNHDGQISKQEWAAVSAGSAPAPSTSCPNCGNIYAADSLFCRKCGMQRA